MLLSTSTDSSVILWTNDSASGLWINAQRFGDIGGQKLGGFVGGLWAAGGDEALAWGWTGGWRRWRESKDSKTRWEELQAITGHQGTVRGLNWSPDGAYVISTRSVSTFPGGRCSTVEQLRPVVAHPRPSADVRRHRSMARARSSAGARVRPRRRRLCRSSAVRQRGGRARGACLRRAAAVHQPSQQPRHCISGRRDYCDASCGR